MKMLSKFVPWGVGAIALFLLIAHTFDLGKIKVDGITVLLLAVIAFLPLIELIRKVKIGEFEAEIAPREVAEASAKVSRDTRERIANPPSQSNFNSEMLDLVQSDPQLGLAKLRMELERILKLLHTNVMGEDDQQRVFSLVKAIRVLTNGEVIPKEISSGLSDVIALANRAVHGEYIRAQDAEELAKLGWRLHSELWQIYKNSVVKLIESKVINLKERDEYSRAKYRVVTVVPLVEEPYLNTYVLDQEGLDNLLTGYDEYAEFIVSVELIK